MRAIVTNFGSQGDFRPLLALAYELSLHGITPVLAFPPFARALAQETPFEFFSVGPDLAELRDQVNGQWAARPELYQSPEEMFRLLGPFRNALPQSYRDLKEACTGADVLIAGAVQPIARTVHETTGIPFVSVQVAHFGGSGGPSMRYAGEELINPFRIGLGLPALKDPLTADANSPQLGLYAISKYLYPQPLEWPKHYHVTGFFFQRPRPSLQIGPELQQFLADDRPFIVITFGSMVHKDPEGLEELLNRAVRLTGYRAIIQGTPPEGNSSDRDPDILRTGFVPHDLIFSRASCVVLHGGAGTSASAFLSGVPAVFVPHGDCYDQRYWAQLAMEAGCALPFLDYSELSADRLASLISRTIASETIKLQVKNLASNIRKEAGVQRAVKLIKDFVSRIGLCQADDLSFSQRSPVAARTKRALI